MPNLPAVRKSLPIASLSGHLPDPETMTQAEFDRLRCGLATLEGLYQRTHNEAVAAIITLVRDRLNRRLRYVNELERMAEQAAPPPSPLGPEIVNRDKFQIGSVGPGANTGPGSVTTCGDAVGRDKIANVTVGEVGTLIVNGPQPASGAALSELEREYLWRLLTVANHLPLGELNQSTAVCSQVLPDIHLEAVYVPLDIVHTAAALQREDNVQDRVPVPALEAVSRPRQPRLVILGDPGSGKTTLLNYLTLCLAGARLYPERGYLDRLNVPQEGKRRAALWHYGALLPVRIELRELVRDIPAGTRLGAAALIEKHLEAQLADHGVGEFFPHIRKSLREGRCLVLFDGLDEIGDTGTRKIVRDSVGAFVEKYGSCRFIATCRALSYTDPAWQLPGFHEVTLAPLSRQSIDAFIESWYATLARLEQLSPRLAKTRADGLRRAARQLFDLAQNPMMLTVMAVVHTYKGTLPTERARLYDDCINLMLWDWERAKRTAAGDYEKGILDILDTREERLVSGLYEVAFHAHRLSGARRGVADISEAEVLNILQKYLDGDWGRAKRFCDYVEKQAGLLISKGKQTYAFIHRGFQEFLAAQHIVTDRNFARVAARLAREGDIWHEVLLQAIGHLVYNNKNTDAALDAISMLCPEEAPQDDAGWRMIWWAGEMLAIVGRSVAEQDECAGRHVAPRLIERLVRLVETGRLTPVERAQAADALGLLGDPRPGVCTPTPEMIRIAGGNAVIGSDERRCRVPLRPFMLARYPVTNAQFEMFIKEGGYRQPRYWTKAGWEWRLSVNGSGDLGGSAFDPQWGIANRPVVGLTWHEALAFANYLKEKTGLPFRLPTEAEWEFAAAGTERRRYPFGARASDDIANIRTALIGQTCAVGAFPGDVTPQGIRDLSGNVWEWCSSLDAAFPYRAADGRENLDAGGARVLRGGSYDTTRREIHCTHRRSSVPHTRSRLIGFRLACDVP
jgi:formylglycine-generating enzyme required for sulfatase activity